MLRKIERLHFEVSALERKIDNIYNSIEIQTCKTRKERTLGKVKTLVCRAETKAEEDKAVKKRNT